MISIQSKVPFDSEVSPGVKYVIRRLSKIQRAKRDLPMTPHRVRFTELHREFQALPDPTLPTTSDADKAKRNALDYEMSLLLDAELKPAAIRAALLSIEGLSVEGYPNAADAVIECGGDALIDEIWGRCEDLAGLSGDKQKNSPSPTTGAEQGTSGEQSSTA